MGRANSNSILRAFTGLVLSVSLLSSQMFVGAFAQVQQLERIDPTNAASRSLSPGAREAAQLLGILPKVERLIQLKQASGGGPLSDEEMALKVDVIDKVLGASLEVRMVAGRVDRELAWATAGHDMLQAKRQKKLNMLTNLNFMQGGTLGILSGPMFLHGYPITGTTLLLLASSIGLGLSTIAFTQQRSGTKKVDGGTTVLADVFHIDLPTPPTHQTDVVTNYMNAVPPNMSSGKSRNQILIDGWKKGKYLGNDSEKSLHKLAAYVPEGKHYKENIRVLQNRIRMLYDTQYTIEMLHSELLDLLRVTQ